MKEICREHGISDATFYNWKAKYGGLQTSEVRRLKDLEEENTKWKGTTSTFTARDMYIAGKGRLTVSLFSLVKVVDVRGPQYDQGEALRWLGESVLYPTNLLPGERLQWTAIDKESAKLTFTYNGLCCISW